MSELTEEEYKAWLKGLKVGDEVSLLCEGSRDKRTFHVQEISEPKWATGRMSIRVAGMYFSSNGPYRTDTFRIVPPIALVEGGHNA